MGEELTEVIFRLIQDADDGTLRWKDIEAEIEAAITELREEDRIVFRDGGYAVTADQPDT